MFLKFFSDVFSFHHKIKKTSIVITSWIWGTPARNGVYFTHRRVKNENGPIFLIFFEDIVCTRVIHNIYGCRGKILIFLIFLRALNIVAAKVMSDFWGSRGIWGGPLNQKLKFRGVVWCLWTYICKEKVSLKILIFLKIPQLI